MRGLITSVDVVEGGVSASIGMSFISDQISAADKAPYLAKESGRNRVVHAARLDAG